jgi:hypothetical protein
MGKNTQQIKTRNQEQGMNGKWWDGLGWERVRDRNLITLHNVKGKDRKM